MTAPVDHPAFRAWDHLFPGSSAPTSVDIVQEGRRASSVYRVIPGGGGQPIIAKRLIERSGVVERVIYEDILPRAGVATAPFLGGTHFESNRWIFMSEIAGRSLRENEGSDRRELAHWLGTLHCAIDWDLTHLPDKSPAHYLTLVRDSIQVLDELVSHNEPPSRKSRAFATVLGQLAQLESHWAALVEECSAGPRTLVHGDLVSHNVFILDEPEAGEARARVLVIDWEKAGWGTPSEDLAAVDIETYRKHVSSRWPFPEAQWQRLATIGRFFRCVVFVDWILSHRDRSGRFLASNLEQAWVWLDELGRREHW